MATITFESGQTVTFDGTPTQRDIEEVAAQLGLSKQQSPATPTQNTYGATFPASPNDSPIAAGMKALGNIPSSAVNMAGGIVSAVAQPIETAKNVGLAATGALDATLGNAIGFQQDAQSKATFNSLLEAFNNRYGTSFGNKKFSLDDFISTLKDTATNDPFGFGTDVASIMSGGAALAGKGAEAAKAISTIAKPVTKTAGAVGENVASKAAATAKFGTSQATGLNPETISSIYANPNDISAAQKAGLNRATLGADVQSTIDNRIAELSDLGKGYQAVRDMQVQVTLPEDWFQNILSRHKLSIDDNGKISTTKESTVLSPTDVSALQSFYDLYARDPLHTPNSFLNTREALAQLAKYDAAKTGNLQSIARDARTELNRFRNQIPNLKQLDEQYAPEVEQLNAIKKEWINRDTGELKDNALSRIANATNDTNAERLKRLEQIQPGISKQIHVLKAIEDIEKTSGIKVGTYARGGTVGGLAVTGNIPAAVITAILTAPEVAVPLIKGLGYTKAKLAPVLGALRQAAGDINNFRIPSPMQVNVPASSK